MTRPKILCLIAAKNLGDITITSTYFRQLVEAGFADRYVVWTRPAMAFLFESMPGVRVVTSSFPVGTNRRFGWRELLGMLRAAREIRRLGPVETLDMVGDFRDRLWARLAGSRRLHYIGWGDGHPYGRIIRNPLGVGRPSVVVPAEVPNIYASCQRLVDGLLAGRSAVPRAASAMRPIRTTAIRVGLHPFASQACKHWPDERWSSLAGRLLEAGIEVSAFGAPDQREALGAIFAAHGQRVRMVTTGIPEFAREIAALDLVVGLDSFSVHMAEHMGTGSVLLLGPNDPSLFSPPHATVLSDSGGCAAWPCFNVPSCEGGPREHACIRAIGVDRVADAVFARLRALRGDAAVARVPA